MDGIKRKSWNRVLRMDAVLLFVNAKLIKKLKYFFSDCKILFFFITLGLVINLCKFEFMLSLILLVSTVFASNTPDVVETLSNYENEVFTDIIIYGETALMSDDAMELECIDFMSVKEAPVFEAVEQPASFPGGQNALLQWLGANIRYPSSAAEKNIQGRVILKFVVEKDGSISNIQVLRGVDADLDKEAVRVIRSMPKWQPGRNNGEVVRTYFTIPITFKLQSE